LRIVVIDVDTSTGETAAPCALLIVDVDTSIGETADTLR